jgi:hypothetical protein
MKKKGDKVENNLVVPYLLSGCFKELASKKSHTYVRCSLCRSNLFKKGKCLNFFIQNGHKKNCKYKNIELPDFKTQELSSHTDSIYSCEYNPGKLDLKVVELKLSFPDNLKGEAKDVDAKKCGVDLSNYPFYDNTLKFNFVNRGFLYKKFDGRVVFDEKVLKNK